ncbi:hypothetical protein ACWKW6_12820 [Dyadobacter jiangsuensis]
MPRYKIVTTNSKGEVESVKFADEVEIFMSGVGSIVDIFGVDVPDPIVRSVRVHGNSVHRDKIAIKGDFEIISADIKGSIEKLASPGKVTKSAPTAREGFLSKIFGKKTAKK